MARNKAQAAASLTRSAAARVAGCSIASIRRAEDAGELRARVVDGVHRFAAHDVEAWAAKRKPAAPRDDAAARAWELYAAGASVFDVVTQLRISPDRARALAASFEAPGALVLPEAAARELASLGFGDARGHVTVASLVAAAHRLRAAARALTRGTAESQRSTSSARADAES